MTEVKLHIKKNFFKGSKKNFSNNFYKKFINNSGFNDSLKFLADISLLITRKLKKQNFNLNKTYFLSLFDIYVFFFVSQARPEVCAGGHKYRWNFFIFTYFSNQSLLIIKKNILGPQLPLVVFYTVFKFFEIFYHIGRIS
jgi:hypothetical protein